MGTVRARRFPPWPAFGLLLASPLLGSPLGATETRLALETGWTLQSSARVRETGEALSEPGFEPTGWQRASVPGTVLAALVDDGVYPDPCFGMNLRSIPGTTYPIGKNFSNLEMPEDSPFAVSWWYRLKFEVPAGFAGKTLWLHLDGINYRANVWLNGKRVAAAEETAGAFRRWELDVSRVARPGAANALAVEVFAPKPNDLAITWVDWNPAPPDKNMGLWGEVWLEATGPVALRHPLVTTELELPSLQRARLTVSAEARNTMDHAVRAVLRGAIEDIRFSKELELAPAERTVVGFTPHDVPALDLARPRLWWPYALGPQNLYTLTLEVETEGTVSDRREVRFGVSQITSELSAEGHRLFRVNGRRILVRGAGWAPDILLRPSPERLEAELRYVKEMNLNTVRLEGKLESDEFYDLADRMGLLVMAGWCCCDHWEQWAKWSPESRRVALASLTDQVRRLRNHPSLLVWLNGSDNPPPPDVERAYLDVLRKEGWPKPVLSSATQQATAVSGPSGVKMTGPYDYVPPSYWLSDRGHGGAFGFNSETSPGPAVPPLESVKAMLPADHLWPMDAQWSFHAGGGQFADLKLFTAALEARYGKATSVENYARKAQALAYEGERAMFEAFGRNKYAATGVIQWMLNNAWPSMIWHLYDYFLRPGGGYFGTKKACEPLHVQYSYDDDWVVVVNGRPEGYAGLKLTAKVYDVGLAQKLSREAILDVPADGVARAFRLPPVTGLGRTYFLRLVLRDGRGRSLSENFYWLSTERDVLDWGESTWYTTPMISHADLTALGRLPATTLAVSAVHREEGAEGFAVVRVTNTGPALAFQVRLRLTDGPGGKEILPVFWEDNYLALMPGETRELRATYRLRDRSARQPAIEADGWNVRLTGG